MRCHGHLLSLAVLTVLCACSGGGSTTPTTTIPQANSTVNAPSGNVRSVQLGLQPMSATLPVVSQITGTLLFPAVRTPMAISLGCSATAPAGVALESMRRAQSGALTVYEYCTIVSPITTSLPSIPAMTLHFPASTPLSGKAFYYGISDLNAQGGLVSFNTHGPGTIDGQTVSFAQVPTVITYEAAHKYTFVVYATGTAPVKVGATKIYVVNGGEYSNVTTYNADGTQAMPTITAGLWYPTGGVAVDAAGKIYVVDEYAPNVGNSLTTYKPDGTRTTPTISDGAVYTVGVAVDAAGKIYFANGGTPIVGTGSVTTYTANGTPTTPTITAGVSEPQNLAVDASGKIYVSNIGNNTVTTYKADGSRSIPTITAGLNRPLGIAVDAARKIYVVNAGSSANNYASSVTTYNADGAQTTPTITVGLSQPGGIAVDSAGKIYVANFGNSTVTTYNPDGTPTTPTLTLLVGVDLPGGIAVH